MPEQNHVSMIVVDMDGTLLNADGQISPRNLAALRAAEHSGIEIVIATGRRHGYAMRQLRGLGMTDENVLISSNGTVTRTVGAKLLERRVMPTETARWLCGHIEEFRDALVITFDLVGTDGEDSRGALVVEHPDELNTSIGKWMKANEPYIAHIVPIEDALRSDPPIQMMLCGTIERMRRAEARLLEHPGVSAVGVSPQEHTAATEIALHRTEYPARNLSIVDILPAGCSKGASLLRLAVSRGIEASQILAIGDNWNDISMLEVAGHCVLMGNAPDDLKQVAAKRGWTIGLRHDEDGVADAIESLLARSR